MEVIRMEKILEQRVTELENAFFEFSKATMGFMQGFTEQINIVSQRISDHTEAHGNFVETLKSITDNLKLIQVMVTPGSKGNDRDHVDLQQKS
jgi:hypothetical protein